MSSVSRFFIPAGKIFNNRFVIEDKQDISKIRRVLRLQPGDKIELNNNQGDIYTAEIEKVRRSGVKGIILEKKDITEKADAQKNQINPDKPYIILAQALPKAKKMDDIIRMNTEIGVNEFIPFESEHSIIKLKDFNPKKLERWSKIAKESARQSERLQIPIINQPATFEQALDINADLKILMHSREIGKSTDIKKIKKQIDLARSEEKKIKILVLIGPEGGFSPKEIDHAITKDFQICHLNLPHSCALGR